MRLALLILLTLAGLAPGQSVTLPKEIKAQPGEWIPVVPSKVDGGAPKWRAGEGLTEVDIESLFGLEKGTSKGRVYKASQPGRYTVEAWNAKGDVASDIAVCVVVVGDAPPVPPTPPTPPNPPTPPTPPNPPEPAPIPVPGFRFLILYESADTLPAQQSSILTAAAVRDFADANCVKGPDGRTPEARIWDWDVDTSSVSDTWRKAVERAKTKAGGKSPYILISNGVTGFEGPLPKTVAETLALLAKYKGN